MKATVCLAVLVLAPGIACESTTSSIIEETTEATEVSNPFIGY